jgi:hypothetical protein
MIRILAICINHGDFYDSSSTPNTFDAAPTAQADASKIQGRHSNIGFDIHSDTPLLCRQKA